MKPSVSVLPAVDETVAFSVRADAMGVVLLLPVRLVEGRGAAGSWATVGDVVVTAFPPVVVV